MGLVYNLFKVRRYIENIDIIFWVRVIVFNATFNNISVISWRPVLLVEETGENQRTVTSH